MSNWVKGLNDVNVEITNGINYKFYKLSSAIFLDFSVKHKLYGTNNFVF